MKLRDRVISPPVISDVCSSTKFISSDLNREPAKVILETVIFIHSQNPGKISPGI